MKNRKIFMCCAFAFFAASLVGGTIAFGANAEENAKTIDEISIGMVKGASMRIASADEENNASATGLRFTMQVSKSDYTALNTDAYDSIEWGVLIAPVESVKAADFTAENLFGENAKYVFNRALTAEDTGKYAAINVTETQLTLASETNLKIENAENTYVFSGYMHTIKEENLTRGFVGRGYVKYTVKGETTPQYKFAEYFDGDVENNTRSAYYVAAKYVADGTVTNAEAKAYVQANYLENETALATANVNITVNDYDEDITIGTYKTEVSATNTVTAKIGETYDLSAEENAKEGYTLRKDLSSAAEPVYRGQVLSMKRYYESNDYIPFSKTANAVSLVEEDGETKGAYKYSGSSGTNGLLLASYNGWNDPYNDKLTRAQSIPNSKIIACYVNMSIRWDTVIKDGGFNLVSNCGDWGSDFEGTQTWCVSTNWFTVNGTSLGDLSFYKESGYPVAYLQPNVWYKVALPIYTNFTKNGKFGSIQLTLDKTQNLYFKDVQIADKDVYAEQVPSETDPYPGETGYRAANGKYTAREFIKDGGAFDDSYKYTIDYDNWQAALSFADAATKTPATSAKFVTAEIYFENVKTFFIRDYLGTTGGNDKSNYKDEFTIGTAKTGGTVLFYDIEGNSVDTLENGVWYKVAIPVKAVAGNYWGSLILQVTGADYQEESTSMWRFNTSQCIYLRNQAYGSTNIYAK